MNVDGWASMMSIDLLVSASYYLMVCTYGGILRFLAVAVCPGEAAEPALRAAAKQMSRKVLVALAGSSALPLQDFATSLTTTSERIGHISIPWIYQILILFDFLS